MIKKTITILLTDICHPVTPRAIEILKKNKDFSIIIIGIDSTNSNYGSQWVDKFYITPNPKSSNYTNELLKICLKEKVDVILPWTNLETLAISKEIQKFKSKNIKVVCNNYKITKTLVNKGLFYQSLKKSNIPIPKYQLVSNLYDLEKAIDQFGYPRNNVVAKPTNLSGGRGLFVLSAKGDIKKHIINNIPKKALLEIIRSQNIKNNLNYMVMEYLNGEDYSVDTLCNEGKPVFIVQRKRMSDIGGISFIGETVKDDKVYNMVKKIIEFFKIDFNCNIQLKYKKGRIGQPYVYDINPRISGTIVANTYAGIDLLTFGIYQALGIPLPKNQKNEYKNLRMVRYWSEKYEKISDELYSA